MSRARRAAATLAALMLGSCVGPPAAPPPPAPPPAPQVAFASSAFVLEGATSQGGIVFGTAPAGTTALLLDGAPVPLAPDGRFLIGFGRDHGPSATLTARRGTGADIVRTLAIAPRQWRIEALPIPRGVSPSLEFQRVRAAEIARIAAARAILPPSEGWRQRFAWPLTGRISGVFGSQRVYQGEKGSFHSGVDIARPVGTPVTAPADGVVILAADHPFTLEGNLLMIDHGMGLSSAFLHLSRIAVKVGDHVRRGQDIGLVGMTGRATGPHLHWGLRWRDERLDPALLAGPMPGQPADAPVGGPGD